jgi:nicotinate-nucleotide adenylyltransferase
MKVGLFGGSFNPAHSGHLHVAETARKRLGLDKILWLVSPGNPLKDPASWGNYADRVQSARDLIAGRPAHKICESETAFDTRYTLDTVQGFLERWPGTRFVWLIGADNLGSFHRWRSWQQLTRTLPIAVISRPGDPVRDLLSPFARQFASSRLSEHQAGSLLHRNTPVWTYITAPLNPLSSTLLREISAMADPVKL